MKLGVDPRELLAPGEEAVAEGRFRGYPPFVRGLALAVVALAIHTVYTVDRFRNAKEGYTHSEVFLGVWKIGLVAWRGDPDVELLEHFRNSGRRYGDGTSTAFEHAKETYSIESAGVLLPTGLALGFAGLELVRVLWWRRRRWVLARERAIGVDGLGRWIGQEPVSAIDAPELARSRAVEITRRRLPLIPSVEAEHVLAPGERIAWEGRPAGSSPG